MAKYMSSVVNYNTVKEAQSAFAKCKADCVLEKHEDGSASIVRLQDKRVQSCQVEYVGNK